MAARSKRLFTAATSNGEHVFDVRDDRATSGQTTVGPAVLGTLGIGGTWDGASVAVEVRLSVDGPWLPIAEFPITADGPPIVFDAPFASLRLTISSAGAGTSLTADFATDGAAVLVEAA